MAYSNTLAKAEQVKLGSIIPHSDTNFTFNSIIGDYPQMIQAINLAKKFAPLDVSILIQGESGTGKEVFAQAIHNASRPNGPFVAVNCAAIPTTLIESELFGYEGGSFTGAERHGRPGKIEMANGGTLFLDEIGDMPLEIQPVLLRVLEEKKVVRVGGRCPRLIDFRILAATNTNMIELVNNGQFRKDLYFRLAAITTYIPPLRERGEDIIKLAQYFIRNIALKQDIPEPYLSETAKFKLMHYYAWQGNVRQLRNAIFYAVNMCSNGIILPEDLPQEFESLSDVYGLNKKSLRLEPPTAKSGNENKLSIKEEKEKNAIVHALRQSNNHISEATAILGLSKSTIYRKIHKYNIFLPNA